MINNLQIMIIFLKSFISLFLVSIFISFFISSNALADNYQLDTFAGKAGYSLSGTSASLELSIQLVINTILSLAGILFVALTVYAGVRWMTAKGNEENITTAKNTLEAAIIGIAIISTSYAISSLIFSKLLVTTPTELPPVDTTVVKIPDGGVCSANVDCQSSICGTDGKCEVTKTKCTKDTDCIAGQVCLGDGVCHGATESGLCQPICPKNQYCSNEGGVGVCKNGCAKSAECDLGMTCSPATNQCEYPSNVGSSCGPSNIGQCHFSPPAGFGGGPVDTVSPCSKNFLVKCWLPSGKCASDASCGNGICKDNICDESPRAVCEKDKTKTFIDGLNVCLFTKDWEQCKVDQGTCIDQGKQALSLYTQSLYQCELNCQTKYDPESSTVCSKTLLPAKLAICKKENSLNLLNCNNGCKNQLGTPTSITKIQADCQAKVSACISNHGI